MKSAFLILSFLISLNAFADEIVEMRGGMALVRCEKRLDSAEACVEPMSQDQPIEIHLSGPQGSTTSDGDYTFRSESDGYSFEGTIYISKRTMASGPRYLIQAWVVSQGQGSNSIRLDRLGAVTVTDMSTLNKASFDGKNIETDGVTLTPRMFFGPRSANF